MAGLRAPRKTSGALSFLKGDGMSQTITKHIQLAIQQENLVQAFSLMGLMIEQSADLRLFHGYRTVALKIPSSVVEQIGFPPTLFSDGVGLDFQDGQVIFIYDHYNQALFDDLAPYVEALNAIGSQAENLRGLGAQGYTFEPVFDLKKQEIGIRAVPPEQGSGGNAWSSNQNGCGVW
jgi:hypothetical protein